MAKLPHGIEKIEALEHNVRFTRSVRYWRNEHGYSWEQVATESIIYFEIKSWLKPVLLHYLQTGVIDGSLADDPVSLKRDNVYDDLHLVLARDITQPILKEYITKNWSTKIKPRVSPFMEARHNAPSFPERDQRVYEDYVNRKKLGLTITGIAYKYHVSESTVKRIVKSKKEAS